MKSKHILSYCPGCETPMVRCATCNNNCCNASYGIINGVQCADCPSAYGVQDRYWKDPSSVEFARVEPESVDMIIGYLLRKG